MPKLVVFRGDAVEHDLRLVGPSLTIGRDKSNDLVLDDSQKGVSRFHAEVRAEAGTYFIVDLKSRNGIWVKGRRITEKAALVLGVPVNLGEYELVLEDDVPSGEFSNASLPVPPTVVNAGPMEQARPIRSATHTWSIRSLVAATNRQVLVWSGVAVAVLLIAVVTAAVVKYRARQTPLDIAIGSPELLLPPSPPAPPQLPGPRALEDPRQGALTERLAAVRKEVDEDHDYKGAHDHVLPVLDVIAQLAVAGIVDFDAESQQAQELKRRAEEGLKNPSPPPPPPPPPPPGPDCPERSGVTKRPNESCADYDARALRILVNLREGNRYLDGEDFANALARFRLVDGDQKGYQGVDSRITETLDKQRKAVEVDMNNAQLAEQAGNPGRARQWYKAAMMADPGATAARERNNLVLNQMNADAKKLFDAASLTRKLGNKEAARKQFQQIVELMLPEDEIRSLAAKELEALGK